MKQISMLFTKQKLQHTLLFLIVLLLGITLRFYQLGAVPGSLDWDEVAIGYNAYSLSQTSKDEYGSVLPQLFRSYGDYKQPVYFYLTVIPVTFFGLTEFAVRFPSALFGSITILSVYFLVYELFRKQTFAKNISLLSMASFAVSPWAIQFSRGGFEANVALFFIITGVWLFLKGLHTKAKLWLFLSTLLFVFSAYTYFSEKLMAPIFLLMLIIYGFTYFKTRKKVAVLLLLLFLVLNLFWIFNTKSLTRGNAVVFTGHQLPLLDSSIQNLIYDKKMNDDIGSLLHNRRIVYAQTFIENYLSHFNPSWLFFTGDTINRHHAPNMGVLYLVSLPFILLGIFFLLSRYFSVTWILFLWFLLAPIAASLTHEAPHSLRGLVFLPTWQIFEAVGLYFFITQIKQKYLRKFFVIVISLLFFINIFYFIHQYFIHTNTDYQKEWQYGYKQAISSVLCYKDSPKRIIYDKSIEQGYMYYAFYSKKDPEIYLKNNGSYQNSKQCYSIDNAYFGDCQDKLRTGDIFITSGENKSDTLTNLQTIRYNNGEVAVSVYEKK